ncbi:hypodermin-A-like, partial [Danaus plexippus]
NLKLSGNDFSNVTLKNDTGHHLSSSCNKALASYPFSVSIQRKGSHYTSGALIGKKWIVTVASEFYNIRETIKLFRARLGTVNCKKGGLLVPIKEIEIHPSYVYRKPNFDISMLKIGHFFDFSDLIKPIALTDVTEKIVSASFLTTYWPRLIVNGRVLDQTAKERMKQNSMRVSTQKMILWEKCFDLMKTQNQTLDESSLCLIPIKSHHSPCMPDAGAPITAEDGLWGITSGWTLDECLTKNSPTLVTRISSSAIRTWLDKLLDSEKK